MSLTAAGILDTKPSESKRLFPGSPAAVKKAFRTFVSEWHPDVNPDPLAARVVAHLVSLRDAALGARPAASPSARPSRDVELADGKVLRIRPLRVHPVDVGELLVLEHSLAWIFDRDAADIAAREVAAVGSFRFADEKMEQEMRRFLTPSPKRKDLMDGRTMLVYPREQNQILLSDLIASYPGGKLPAEHAAWICSGLMNIACWLFWSGKTHGGISPETVMITPETHAVHLVGGWGFSINFKERPQVLPSRTLSLMPRLAVAGVTADRTIDLELVRRTVKECLGDPAGSALYSGLVPPAIAGWLTLPPALDTYKDYAGWGEALKAAWGKRRFVVMERDPAEIYAS